MGPTLEARKQNQLFYKIISMTLNNMYATADIFFWGRLEKKKLVVHSSPGHLVLQ